MHFDKERLAASKSGLKGSTELVKFILEKAGVAAVQGEAFGDDSAFRISVAASDDSVGRGIQAISECMKELMAS
jgi:aspartate/methionine/tyrosine aminotransferase